MVVVAVLVVVAGGLRRSGRLRGLLVRVVVVLHRGRRRSRRGLLDGRLLRVVIVVAGDGRRLRAVVLVVAVVLAVMALVMALLRGLRRAGVAGRARGPALLGRDGLVVARRLAAARPQRHAGADGQHGRDRPGRQISAVLVHGVPPWSGPKRRRYPSPV